MPKVAISYIRFSTPEQAKGNSFRRQIEDSRAWCERNDYTLDTSYKLHDLGVSGFKGHNAKTGKLKAFIGLLEAGKVEADALIIESLDRLSRDEVGDALTLFLGILSHGIKIITTKPENVFDRKSINNPVNLIMAIMEICRGFSESNIKSERVADAWKTKKENARTGHKVSSACPSWLKLNEDKSDFDFVPEKAASVRRLIELAKSGMGVDSITKILNREKLPTLKNFAKHWHASTVYKTLTNRALFGEYQPKFANKNISERHRQSDGLPISGYYKPLITEAEFYQIQNGLQARRQMAAFGTGRKSAKVSNLFGDLLKDVRTGSTFCRVDKGKKSVPCLMSSEVKAGVAKRETFPYDDFEDAFLGFLRELSIEDLSSSKQLSQAQERLLVVRGRIQEVSQKLNALKARLDQDDIETLMDWAKDLETELKKLLREEELLKAETSRPNPTKDMKSIIKLLGSAIGDDLTELRSRIRFLLCELIEVVFMHIERDGNKRRLHAQIHFRNKTVRRMSLLSYLQYAGGGAENPVPVRVCTSMSSTPMDLFGEIPTDWFGETKSRPIM